MATSSFDKVFVIHDLDNILQLQHDAQKPKTLPLPKTPHNHDEKQGIDLLKQRLSRLKP